MMTRSQLDDDNVSIQLVPHVLVVRSVQYNSEIVRACLPTLIASSQNLHREASDAKGPNFLEMYQTVSNS